MATQLPTVMLKGVRFIIDERLHEIRDINNPHVREDFDDLTDESRAQVMRELAFFNRPTGQHK